MNNSFGDSFRISLFGESHTPSLGVVIEGVPQSFDISRLDFETDLSRRRSGRPGTTPRIEADEPLVEDLRSQNGTIRITFENTNTRSSDYSQFEAVPRPGHADFTSRVKYGHTFPGGGIFSGRMTLPIVAAGVLAKKLIEPQKVEASLVEIGGIGAEDSAVVENALKKAAREGDSLGGVVECRCTNVPAGLGEPFFDSVESLISHAMFSIPGIRGIEFGEGFEASRSTGFAHNDAFIDEAGHTLTNHAGGVNGGITNGNPLIFRVAVKPTSSIRRAQTTFDFASGRMTTLEAGGRHDVCFALRVPPVVEALTAIVLANLR